MDQASEERTVKGLQPGQYLSDYLDKIPKLQARLPETDVKKFGEIIKRLRGEGIVFLLPPDGVLTDRMYTTIPPENTKPPYPVTILEFALTYEEDKLDERLKSYRRIVAAIDHGNGVLLVPLFHTNAWHTPYFGIFISYTEPVFYEIEITEGKKTRLEVRLIELLPATFKYVMGQRPAHETPEITRNELLSVCREEINAYLDFCKVLHDNEVTITDAVPDASANQMRRARGKTQLFTYKVLTIGGLKKHSKHAGGTHASPRSHLRRGYYRNYKSGKRAWVNACMIKGNGEGFVHKDYNVLGQEGASTQ